MTSNTFKRRPKNGSKRKPIHRAAAKRIRERFLAEARRHVGGYRILVSATENHRYVGRVIELPGVIASGDTPDECLRVTIAGAETLVASMLQDGDAPPKPARSLRRTEQINIRLTPEEKEILMSESARRGMRGLSDAVREILLEAFAAQKE